MNKTTSPILGITLAGVLALVAQPTRAFVNIDYVTVGDVGNAADTTGYGAVAYVFQIGTYEVTNAQYAEFLNNADPTGANPNGIYNASMGSDVRGGITFTAGAGVGSKYSLKTNMGNKPVNYVSHLDSQRFTNWLHNGQGAGSTETGAYTVGNLATHNVSATVWIATEDEWYKAAYYQPVGAGGDIDSYWYYPTRSNSAPTIAGATATGDISNPGTNVANYFFGADWNGQDGNVTTVGSAGAGSAGYYGTYDQAGNMYEWNDAVDGATRGFRGGSWYNQPTALPVDSRGVYPPETEYDLVGFRVATVPEPTSALLLLCSGMMLLLRRRRASAL